MKAWQTGARLGRFVLGDPLGQGGMGMVYRCHDPETGQVYAVKTLASAADPELRLRFQREGEAQARVDRHPHVLRIHAAGSEGGRPYLVMDLAPGGDLARRLARDGPLEPLLAANLGACLAAGLAHVHAQGVLHRDLKPQNVLFDEHGEPQLVDFGLAHLAGGHSLTEPGELLGTPAYMAPEQANGTGTDARSDVYGLGAVLYHTVTGRPPYQGRTAAAVLQALAQGPPPPARSLRPDLPADLDRVLTRAMARDPRRRYPSAIALADDLRRVAQGGAPSHAGLPAPWLALGAALTAVLLGGLWAWSGRAPRAVPVAAASLVETPTPAAEPVHPPPSPSPKPEAPTLEDELEALYRQIQRALRRPHEDMPLSGLSELRFLIDSIRETENPVEYDRSLAMLASRLRSHQRLLSDHLDYTRAFVRRLHELAAARGDPLAMHELGNFLCKYTVNPEADREAAERALRVAAAADFPPSQRQLARLLLERSDPASAAEALGLLERAIAVDRDAKVVLAQLLLPTGDYAGLVDPKPQRAVRLLEEATKASSAQAAGLLAKLHLRGEHVTRDPRRAVEILTQAERTEGGRYLADDLGDALRDLGDPACVEAYERGLRRRGSRSMTRDCHRGLARWYAQQGDEDLRRVHEEAAAALAAFDDDDDDVDDVD